MQKILIIDNEGLYILLYPFLIKNGYETISMNTGRAAIEWLKTSTPGLVLCNFMLEDISGTMLLTDIKEKLPAVPVIIITGNSNVKEAVRVMKKGAYDYIAKPFFPEDILLTIKKALSEVSDDKIKRSYPGQPLSTITITKDELKTDTEKYTYQYIVGTSASLASTMKQVELVAPTNYSVILYGESGSGKEVIAQQIHRKSKRAGKPFIAIDCGALSKELAGSELFGHEKGAFTGALCQKVGSLELANGGTVFLDEVSNLPYEVQISLLRVVQERRIKRLGSTRDISLDVRIIVASNEKLWAINGRNKFREDLYHRINEFSIEVPPLRNRQEDILLYAAHFLKLTNRELGKEVKGFTKEVQDIFYAFPWYGNLREMSNVIKRATLLTNGDIVEAGSLPEEIFNYQELRLDFDNVEETKYMAQNKMRESPMSKSIGIKHKKKVRIGVEQNNIITTNRDKLLNFQSNTRERLVAL